MQAMTKQRHMDMLNGPLWSKLPRYALPVAATGILGQLFNAADVAVVGNFTGELRTVAVAAVGANSPVIGLLLNLFIGIALGANVVIANAIGRGDRETVHRAVHTSIVTALVGGVLVALFGQLVAGGLMGLLNVPEDVYPLALSYLRIYLLGMPVILLYNFEAAIFRSIGDTKMPLAALTVSGILNVILNLFFVIVLKMNVNGVAIATVLSNAVSSVLLLRRLLHGDLVRVELRELRIDRNAFNKIMRIGLPAGIQTAIFSLSNIIIQSAINSLGTVVMAASSAAFNIEIIAYDVLNSFSQACTTFVGQNYGAGKIDRCKKTMFLCLIEDFIASAAAIALVLLTGKYILAIFNSDPEVIAIGYTRLLFLFGSYIFTLTYEILSGYLRGFGISLAPAILTLFGVCGVRIFWIKAIFPMHRTFQSILLAYPISLATTTVLIIAALLGILCSLSGVVLPTIIIEPIRDLAGAAAPIAMLGLGARLNFRSAAEHRRLLAAGCVIKLILLPAAVVAAGWLLGFRRYELGAIFIDFAMPTASVVAIMADSEGGDAALAGEMVVFTSAFSCFTIFAGVYLMRSIGLF